MGKNSDRWKDFKSKLDSISDLNTYIEPVNGTDVKAPFVVIKLEEVKNLLRSGQACSIYDGILVNVKLGVYSERDKEEEQSDSIAELLDLFDSVQQVAPLDSETRDATSYSSVFAQNSNCYIIEYSGYYK